MKPEELRNIPKPPEANRVDEWQPLSDNTHSRFFHLNGWEDGKVRVHLEGYQYSDRPVRLAVAIDRCPESLTIPQANCLRNLLDNAVTKAEEWAEKHLNTNGMLHSILGN
ncbi:hypothetical protein [Mycobacterium riyadhense]|uniref:hypothetical protein n=1 Tax=Mycobacterium riyadhense TaxID=486698 RepID=UPI0019514C51|nr:hypothetical protein [Mycobacterium riyadhense]